MVIQATASTADRKPISWNKAQEVLSSVGYSGSACNFVTVGRPEFHDVAIGNANEIRDRGEHKLLLVALPEVVELCLKEAEQKCTEGTLLAVFQTARGHYVAAP